MSLLKYFPHLKHDARTKDSQRRHFEMRLAHYSESLTTERLLKDITTLFEQTNDAELVRIMIDSKAESHAKHCKKCQGQGTCSRFDEIQAISEILFL